MTAPLKPWQKTILNIIIHVAPALFVIGLVMGSYTDNDVWFLLCAPIGLALS